MKYEATELMSWTRLGMRKAFGEIIQQIAEEHDDLIVLTADVASSANLNGFAKKYQDRFFNIGIAEQNMVAVAAGLAKEGRNVFVVTFAPFVAMRAFEAIRTLVGYMHLNVKIVALSSGMSLGAQGSTHFCLEDIALMRTIPGLKVFSPADCFEMAKCMEYLAGYKGPAYLRLTGIDGSMRVYREECPFFEGKNITVREGKDVAIFATGSVVAECVRASRALNQIDISCAVIDVCTIKPFESSVLEQSCKDKRLIVTVEEHTVFGGLGGLIAENLAAMRHHPPLARIGICDEFPVAGDYSYVLEKCGLSASKIRDTIVQFMEDNHD